MQEKKKKNPCPEILDIVELISAASAKYEHTDFLLFEQLMYAWRWVEKRKKTFGRRFAVAGVHT